MVLCLPTEPKFTRAEKAGLQALKTQMRSDDGRITNLRHER
jgi:hypothetical protein